MQALAGGPAAAALPLRCRRCNGARRRAGSGAAARPAAARPAAASPAAAAAAADDADGAAPAADTQPRLLRAPSRRGLLQAGLCLAAGAAVGTPAWRAAAADTAAAAARRARRTRHRRNTRPVACTHPRRS
jgi:hypothetical protein